MHGSALEWVQFLTGLTGTVLNFWAWYATRRDFFWVRDHDTDSPFVKLVAEGTYAADSINLMVALSTLVAGITAVLVAPPPGEFTITAIWKLYALILISVLVAVQGYRARWYRRQLLGLEPMDRRTSYDRRVGYDRRKGQERRNAERK